MERAVEVPGHVVIRPLRHGSSFERTVLLTERLGARCVTRIWNTVVPREQLETLRSVAFGLAIPPGVFPSDLAADFEGYRVRASLGEFPSLPEVVEVGLLSPEKEHSRPFITTRWIEGETLHDTLRRYDLDTRDRERMLQQILQILVDLHERNVLHGDLKPENVIVGGDGIHLIDLDTLRQVEGPTDFATVSQVTWSRVWPECQRDRPDGQRDYIASLPSDLWAYGLLVSELLGGQLPGNRGFPPELPAPWGAVLKACLRANPSTRPNTAELLKAVNGLPHDLSSWMGDPFRDDETVRVPDRNPTAPRRPVAVHDATDRVEEDTRNLPDPAAVLPTEKRRRRWPGRRLLYALLAPIVLLSIAGGWLLQENEAESPELMALRHRLKEHKSVPRLNNIGHARLLAAEAGELAYGPNGGAEAWGIYALLSVWGEGWHFGGQGRLNAQKFALHYARAGFALEEGVTSEALLARAIAAGAACRLLRDDPARLGYCEESRQRTRQLLRRNLDGWLTVEVLWNAGMVERNESLSAWGAEDMKAFRRFARADLDYCDTGEQVVDEAPINGPEFAEHCIAAALAIGEVGKWLWWIELLELTQARDRSKIAEHVFRNAHPSCRRLSPQWSAGQGGQGGESGPGDYDAPGFQEYCTAQALTAMQCPERALRVVCGPGEEECEFPRATDVPWDLARRARRMAPTGACFLDD